MRTVLLGYAAFALWATSAVAQQGGSPAPTVLQAAGKDGAVALKSCGPVHVIGAKVAVRTKSGTTTADVVCDGLQADVTRSGVILGGNVRNVTFRNFHLAHGPVPSRAPNLPSCFQIDKGVNGLTLEDGLCTGFFSAGMKYPNGDGPTVNSGAQNVVIRRVTSIGASDSAFDVLKGSGVLLDDVTGGDADRCLKAGAARLRVTTITCRGISEQVIQLRGNTLPIEHLIVDPAGTTKAITVFYVDNATAVLDVKRCTFLGALPKGSRLVVKAKGAKVTLGAGCELPRLMAKPSPDFYYDKSGNAAVYLP